MGSKQWRFLSWVLFIVVVLSAISGSKGSSPMMSPISLEGKPMHSPLPSHPHFFESSLVMSPGPHEIKPPSNAPAPLASYLQASEPSSPIGNPMPPEGSTPSNVTFAPLPSPFEVKNYSNTTRSASPSRNPSPHEVKEPSNATHSPLPSLPLPLESSPSISPASHEMKEPSNNTYSPLPSPPLSLEYSPANSLTPHEAAGPAIIAHSPLPSHPSSSSLSPTMSLVNSSFPSQSLPLEFSPAISPTQHEVKDPPNVMHAPLISDPKPLRTSPMISPTPHEVKDPSNISHSHLPSHCPPELSPLPSRHEVKDPSNIMHAPLASDPKPLRTSPMISPTPHEVKNPSNITRSHLPLHSPPALSPLPSHFASKDPSNAMLAPLPSHHKLSRISPMISPPPHDVKKPSNFTFPPLPSDVLPSLSSPFMSPMPHEVKTPSNVTLPPLSSHSIPSLSSPTISPASHGVKKPTNITRSPLPSQPTPSENAPSVSPLPHGVREMSNVAQAPLVSPPRLRSSSPLISPMPYEVKNATHITHAPFSSHRPSPLEKMIQTPAWAPTISRPQHDALSFSSPPAAHYPGPTLSPVHSHIPEVLPKNKQRKHAPSPYIRGPSISPNQFLLHPRGVVPKHNQRIQAPLLSPVQVPIPSKTREGSHAPSPSSVIPSRHNKWPIHPSVLPPVSSRKPRAPSPQLVWALPPPPPNLDCKPLSCQDPVTYPPPGSLCVCVLPIKVSLHLSVALYAFFPLVTELAQEIASGIFLKQSQVRIMGANAASEDPEKTVVLIYLVPLGRSFDVNTALLIYERFWHKQVFIKALYFGDYDVLYVAYPGLPPSPPMAPGDVGVDGGTFTDGENARRIKPLGVDVRKREEKVSGSIIAIIVLSSVVALVISVAAAWILLIRRSPNRPPSTSDQPLSPVVKPSGSRPPILGNGPSWMSASFTSSTAKTFSLAEIERATNRFHDSRILGEGGFGRVYQGTLEDGTMVAVKVLKRDDNQGGREFLAEVEMLGRLHHRNLVKLIGICTEENVRCLVYELIPNGSVESHLHGPDKEASPLDWNARMRIALGAARGLAYLHEDSSPRVIHRDFKSSNILLEYDFTPKVSDFGLAREALDEGNDHISTRVMGTFGYVAPEYAMTGHLLVKSDVYSYGVVLLELLTGRKPVDMSQPPGQETLVNWARPLLTSTEGLEKMIDPALGTSISWDTVAKVAAIASMCVQPEVSYRPFMGEVVQALKLVCNESDEFRRSYSQDELSTRDSDVKISSEERMLSGSDIFCTSATLDKDASGSLQRYFSSGPMKTGRSERMWEKVRKFSSGSMIENPVAHGLGSGMESEEHWP